VIDKNGYHATESSCDIARVFVAGVEGNAKVFQVKFRNCQGEAYEWKEIWRAYVGSDGRLSIRQKITNDREAF
jgi:hypothetical protein